MSPTTLTVPRFAGLTGAIVAALFTALFAMKLTALFTAKLALKPPLLFPSPRIHSGQSIALGPLPAAALPKLVFALLARGACDFLSLGR